MPMTPLPHQIAGAEFLASRRTALLADAPRVGKTGASILAADLILPRTTLVVTTASGRPVWERGFRDWSAFGMSTAAIYPGVKVEDVTADRLIVAWTDLAKLAPALTARRWDLLILDESHYAKSPDAKRTQAAYGVFRGAARDWGLCDAAEVTWCLTGTPIPNAPNDLYPMLRALAPERLTVAHGPTDVTKYDDFVDRYCVTRTKVVGWTRIRVVVAGRRPEELKARMEGFFLRRLQRDVGILPPVFDLLDIHITDRERETIEREFPGAGEVLDAADTGETSSLEMALGTLRRLTGSAKVAGVVRAVLDEAENTATKFVLMCWHEDAMTALCEKLSSLHPVRISGSTDPDERQASIQRFQTDPTCRVFVGQIMAAGEAIDLSVAEELIFVESMASPGPMAQAAMRVTNLNATRRPRVRVAALAGSVDEKFQRLLLGRVETNKAVMA
jgi:superfamily II DNA or RNA helicase